MVHELTHHFVHAYGVDVSPGARELVARNFEVMVAEHEFWLEQHHLLSETPDTLEALLDSTEFGEGVPCELGLTVRAETKPLAEGHLVCHAARRLNWALAPWVADSAGDSRDSTELMVTVVDEYFQYMAGMDNFRGLYLADRGELLLSRDQALDSHAVLHFLAHHYGRGLDERLAAVDLETLCALAPWVVGRVEQGYPIPRLRGLLGGRTVEPD